MTSGHVRLGLFFLYVKRKKKQQQKKKPKMTEISSQLQAFLSDVEDRYSKLVSSVQIQHEKKQKIHHNFKKKASFSKKNRLPFVIHNNTKIPIHRRKHGRSREELMSLIKTTSQMLTEAGLGGSKLRQSLRHVGFGAGTVRYYFVNLC